MCTSACILFIRSTEPRESVLTLLLYVSSALTGRGGEGLDSSSNTLLWEKEGSRPAEQNENIQDVSPVFACSMLQVITKSEIETLGPVLPLKVQGVVTNILPVEAFVTGVKNLALQIPSKKVVGHNIDRRIIDNLPTLHARAEPTMPPPTTTRSYTSFPTEELQSLLPAGRTRGAASRCKDPTTAMQTLAAFIWAWRKFDIILVCNLHSIFNTVSYF